MPAFFDELGGSIDQLGSTISYEGINYSFTH
jgi:hypothetical protein